MVKVESLSTAERVIASCGVNITVVGKHHLGILLLAQGLCIEQYMVDYWVSCVQRLHRIARVQPIVLCMVSLENGRCS